MDLAIEKYGFFSACSSMRNEFWYIDNGKKIAQGRTGLQPFYWDKKGHVSYQPIDGYELFPPGHLWDSKDGRLIRWDPMVFDKPTWTNPSAKEVIKTIKESINHLNCEVCLLSSNHGIGSTLLSKFIPDDMPTITAVPYDVDDPDGESDFIFRYEKDLNMFEAMAEKFKGKRVLTGFGCRELFTNRGQTFQPTFPELYGLDAYSPFLDVNVIDHVMDSTNPLLRKTLLVNICVD